MFTQVEDSMFQRVGRAISFGVGLVAVLAAATAFSICFSVLIVGSAILAWNFILAPATGLSAIAMTNALWGGLILWVIGVIGRLVMR